jgi:hypothetical protein
MADPIAVTAVEVAAARAYRRMREGHVHEAVANLADAVTTDDDNDEEARGRGLDR